MKNIHPILFILPNLDKHYWVCQSEEATQKSFIDSFTLYLEKKTVCNMGSSHITIYLIFQKSEKIFMTSDLDNPLKLSKVNLRATK